MNEAEISGWIGTLEEYNLFLRTVPLSKEYRDTATFRQFGEVRKAKREQLGLTDDVMAELNGICDHDALNWAFVEIGMTLDNRELLCASYFEDLPLNYYWMPEYDAVREAVEAQWQSDDDSLEALVRKLAPPIPNTKHDDGVSGVLFG